MKRFATLVLLVGLLHECGCFVIRPLPEDVKHESHQIGCKPIDEWNILKEQLALTDQKVKLLKSQKNQEETKELLKLFIKENPQLVKLSPESSNAFYCDFINKLRASTHSLRTTVNFELRDKPLKPLKRVQRKISVKLTSDMPSDEIDKLLALFNEQHGIRSPAVASKELPASGNADHGVDDDDADDQYNDIEMHLPSALDSEYMYSNLYEDEKDLSVPPKSHHNSEYSSFQDLIMQAGRSQWQRQLEETKLLAPSNDHHFV